MGIFGLKICKPSGNLETHKENIFRMATKTMTLTNFLPPLADSTLRYLSPVPKMDKTGTRSPFILLATPDLEPI
jgi:hypothetical protein